MAILLHKYLLGLRQENSRKVAFLCVLSDRNRLAPSIMQVRMFTKSAFSFVVCKHGIALPRFYVKKPQPNATMAIFPFLYSLRHKLRNLLERILYIISINKHAFK